MPALTSGIAQFSLKHLLLASTAVAGVLGLGIACGFSVASALVLVLGLWLTVNGIRKQRIRRTAVGIPLAFVGGCGTGLALVIWLVFGLGPIYLPDYYPAHVQQMIEVAQADPWRTKVYRYDNGTGFFLEDVSRMQLSQSQVDRLVAEFGLAEVDVSEIDPWFFRRFPRDWQPRQRSESKFYKGTRDMADYNAMYDPPSARFYVWCIEDYN